MLWIIIIAFCLVLLLIFLPLPPFLISSLDHRIAKDPEKIADRADWDIPAYDVISQTDNMDRGASAWSFYEWEVQLKELSEEDIEDLDELVEDDENWRFEEIDGAKCYICGNDDTSVKITMNTKTLLATLSYLWWDYLS